MYWLHSCRQLLVAYRSLWRSPLANSAASQEPFTSSMRCKCVTHIIIRLDVVVDGAASGMGTRQMPMTLGFLKKYALESLAFSQEQKAFYPADSRIPIQSVLFAEHGFITMSLHLEDESFLIRLAPLGPNTHVHHRVGRTLVLM